METVAGAAARLLAAVPPPPSAPETLPARVRQEPLVAELTLSQSRARAGEALDARITLRIDRPWWLVADDRRNTDLVPLAVSVLSPELQVAAPVLPAPRVVKPGWASRPVALLQGEITARVPLRVQSRAATGAKGVRVRLHFQACDTRRCRPPESVMLEAPLIVDPAPR
jgi:hypothetical protein